jgi:hypothetical protein
MENIRFAVRHLKELVEVNKIEDAKAFINKFFFKYMKDIFSLMDPNINYTQ